MPMGHHSSWKKVPHLQLAYHPMLKRIQFLVENGLMSMMMLFDFLSKRIAPPQLRAAQHGCTPRRMMPRDWSTAVG
jgi:hypothetical protein